MARSVGWGVGTSCKLELRMDDLDWPSNLAFDLRRGGLRRGSRGQLATTIPAHSHLRQTTILRHSDVRCDVRKHRPQPEGSERSLLEPDILPVSEETFFWWAFGLFFRLWVPSDQPRFRSPPPFGHQTNQDKNWTEVDHQKTRSLPPEHRT